MSHGDNAFSPGDVIERRYRVVRLVGTGAMGEVYQAEDLEIDESASEEGSANTVAIKTVRPDLLRSAKALARFKREADLSQRIQHPGVLRIGRVFTTTMPGDDDAGTVPCMVMEWLAGETLADRLVDERLIDPDEGVAVACQMASALTAAHRAGVVHRDLKPDNVFLVYGGGEDGGIRVVLTDFGVARAAKRRKDESLTASNVILGTPEYLAPELLDLEDATPRSDLYTMGLVMFEMLTGKPPFEADTPLKMVFMRAQQEPPSPRKHLPDLDRRWEEVILRCLARKPEDRYAEALDLISVLDGEDSRWLKATAADRLKRFPALVRSRLSRGWRSAVKR